MLKKHALHTRRARRNSTAMAVIMQAVVFLTLLFVFAWPVKATEYSLQAYFADPSKIADAIGSNDTELQEQLLSMQDWVKKQGLEKRFTPPDQWQKAVKALVAGKERENEYINGFAVQMLLIALAETAPQSISPPFSEISSVYLYLMARGNTALAGYLDRIDYGNTAKPYDGLPEVLKNKIGESEYPARISVFTPSDAKIFLSELAQFEAVAKEMRAYTVGEENALASNAEKILTATIEKQSREYYEANKDSIEEGETIDQAVERDVQSEMEDPYSFYDNIFALEEELPTLRLWLEKSVNEDKALFLVYSSS